MEWNISNLLLISNEKQPAKSDESSLPAAVEH